MERLRDFAEEEDLVTEPIYGTRYKKEKISEETLAEWKQSMPKEGEVLDYPVSNVFVPQSIPEQQKAEKETDSERLTPPTLIQ